MVWIVVNDFQQHERLLKSLLDEWAAFKAFLISRGLTLAEAGRIIADIGEKHYELADKPDLELVESKFQQMALETGAVSEAAPTGAVKRFVRRL